jgi:hypothetical protein
MKKTIIVTKTNEDGAIQIDARDYSIVTPAHERPEWADGIAVASYAERTKWYESRLGTQLPEELRSPEVLNFADLSWIGHDEAGDEVELDADNDYRMDVLSEILGVDRERVNEDPILNGNVVSVEVDRDYAENPTDEMTLRQVEGLDFSTVSTTGTKKEQTA